MAGVVTLVDIRHGPTTLDLELQELLLHHERKRVVVLTKADKVGRGRQKSMQLHVQRTLGLAVPPTVVSVTTGEGRSELLRAIGALVDTWRSR